MYLDTFTFMALCSYFMGSLPLTHLLDGFSEKKQGFFLILFSILQGASVFLLAHLLIGTGVAAALGGLFLFFGQRFSLFRGFKAEGLLIFKALGFWLPLTPLPILASFILFLIFFFFLRLLLKRPIVISILLVYILFPLVTWFFTFYDLFLILATISSLFLIYELAPQLFRPFRYRRFLFNHGIREKKRGAITRARILLLTCTLLFSLVFLLNRYVYRGFGLQVDLFSQGNPNLPYIALTFDDGPDPEYTPAILDILAEYGVKATFFMVGDHVQLYPDLARRIVAEGHEIGNHTQHHRNLYRLRPDLILEEMLMAEETIFKVTGERVYLFRPPRGLYDNNVREIALERGYTLVLWSLSSRDWAEVSARSIEHRILTNTKGGDVLLFHDSGSIIYRRGGDRYNTIKALPGIISGLQEMGFRFLTISELIIIDELSRERSEKDDPESILPGY